MAQRKRGSGDGPYDELYLGWRWRKVWTIILIGNIYLMRYLRALPSQKNFILRVDTRLSLVQVPGFHLEKNFSVSPLKLYRTQKRIPRSDIWNLDCIIEIWYRRKLPKCIETQYKNKGGGLYWRAHFIIFKSSAVVRSRPQVDNSAISTFPGNAAQKRRAYKELLESSG